MTAEKVSEALAIYRKQLVQMGIFKERQEVSAQAGFEAFQRFPGPRPTASDIRVALAAWEEIFQLLWPDITAQRLPTHVTHNLAPRVQLAHVRAMLPLIEEFLKEERIGKAMRWTGFAQGVLWIRGTQHARPSRARTRYEQLAHADAIVDDADQVVATGDLNRAFWLLGFVQGVLFATDVYHIEDLKNHNRP